jgi:hypothetical protein
VRSHLFAFVVALLPVAASAQTPTSASPAQAPPTTVGESAIATRAGSELNFGISGYNYVEPGSLQISIHGPKFSGEYTGTMLLNPQQHWFVKANARASFGSTSYDGWCAPWMITPDSSSPNGWALDLGDYSPCSESGDADWYVEARGLVGKDFIAGSWAWSPESGLGVRHLSNGISGVNGFRTDNYLYLPVGITARTRVASHGLLSFNLEYDLLLRGWQTTYTSKLGGGIVPATPTAPEFTIEGFSDASFDQHKGSALRASAKYQINRRMLLEPYFVYWRVEDSDVNYSTATYTVNGITVQQQLGFLEPLNTTREGGIKIGFRF